MPRTQEIPQVYPENIPMVSMFQGYNPETMAQVEGPQQGGWVPLMQDPITMGALAGGGAAVAGIPGMFAQLAQMYGPQMVPQAGNWRDSVMEGYKPPGMVYNRGVPTPAAPKAYVTPSGVSEAGYGSPVQAQRDLPTFREWAQSTDPGKRQFAENAIRQIESEMASPMVPLRGSPTTPIQSPNWPTMPELSGPKGMGPIGGPATAPMGLGPSPLISPGYTMPDFGTAGGGFVWDPNQRRFSREGGSRSTPAKATQNIGDEGFAMPTQPFTAREKIGLRDLQTQKSQSIQGLPPEPYGMAPEAWRWSPYRTQPGEPGREAPSIFKSTGRELTDEELQRMSRSRPISEGDLHRMLQDWMRIQKQKEGWTKIPIQTGPPTTSVDEMLRMHGTPARPTAPFTVVPGQQVLGGAAPTTELPSLTDLFRGIPE